MSLPSQTTGETIVIDEACLTELMKTLHTALTSIFHQDRRDHKKLAEAESYLEALGEAICHGTMDLEDFQITLDDLQHSTEIVLLSQMRDKDLQDFRKVRLALGACADIQKISSSTSVQVSQTTIIESLMYKQDRGLSQGAEGRPEFQGCTERHEDEMFDG